MTIKLTLINQRKNAIEDKITRLYSLKMLSFEYVILFLCHSFENEGMTEKENKLERKGMNQRERKRVSSSERERGGERDRDVDTWREREYERVKKK